MSTNTEISWCDSTHNHWLGCANVSPGCDHCYAEALIDRRFGRAAWGPKEPRVLTSAANRRKPLAWARQPWVQCTTCAWRGTERDFCPACEGHTMPTRRRVFSASLSDWLDNAAPVEWLVELLDLVRRTPELDWLLLSKRIGNWRSRLDAALIWAERNSQDEELCYWIGYWLSGAVVPKNVWLGATIVNQQEADRDIQKLLQVPARVRFLSMEPLLGPVRLPLDRLAEWNALAQQHGQEHATSALHWVIVGGESGPAARPMHPDWVRQLRDQCAAAGVSMHFKQWGEHSPFLGRVGKRAAGRLLDGRTHDAFPAVRS